MENNIECKRPGSYGDDAKKVEPRVVPETEKKYKPFDYPSIAYRDPSEGWTCPRCGTCWSPDIPKCTCEPEEIKDQPSERIEK